MRAYSQEFVGLSGPNTEVPRLRTHLLTEEGAVIPAKRTLAKPAKGTAAKERRARKRAADRTLEENAQIARWRDSDRCRACGSGQGVEVHHVKFRSQGGTHHTSNLACLCLGCHAAVHARRLVISGNADEKLKIERAA